jgi:hypothetical protein
VAVDEIREAVDRAYPSFRGRSGDWDGIIDAARRPAPDRSQRWIRPALVAAAGVVAAVLLWPGDDSDRVLERARAAVAGGPVVHLVLRAPGETAIDLRTGKRRQLRGQHEQWFDPDRGLHDIYRVGGKVRRDVFYPAGSTPEFAVQFTGLATAYRQALEGDASVESTSEVNGRTISWIRYRVRYPSFGIPTYEAEHEVGVDENGRPRYLRLAGETGPGAEVLIWETLRAGSGDFTGRSEVAPEEERWFGVHFIGARSPETAGDLDGRSPFWLGEEFESIPLRIVARYRLESSRPYAPPDINADAVEVCYGTGDVRGCRATGGQYLILRQSASPHPFYWTPDARMPEEDTLVLEPSGLRGWALREGVYIVMEGSSPELIERAARALRPTP